MTTVREGPLLPRSQRACSDASSLVWRLGPPRGSRVPGTGGVCPGVLFFP